MKRHHLQYHFNQLLRQSIQLSSLFDSLDFVRYSFSFRRALEIALLLKEHPDCTCVLVTLIQEYQSRFQKPLHVSELYTMKHVIDIQDYGGNRVARLLPAFRVRFDENNIQVNLFFKSDLFTFADVFLS